MDEKDRAELLQMLRNQHDAGYGITGADLIKAKIDLEMADSQIRSALASERNARYMLWSTIAAAVSAAGSLAAVLVSVIWHV